MIEDSMKQLRMLPCGLTTNFFSGFGKPAEIPNRFLIESKKIEWSTERKNAVTELKEKLLEAPNSRYPIGRDPETLTTDVLLTCIKANFTRKQRTEDRVTAYASKPLGDCQRNYSATEQESIENIHFTQHFKTTNIF